MRFAREALPFVLPLVLLAIAAVAAGWPRIGVTIAVLALAVLWFFRVPTRPPHSDPAVVLAPANGVITAIDEVVEERLGEAPVRRIVTFLSVFNVHVQRAPVSGEVIISDYQPGRKVAAFREDAGEVNEYHFTALETGTGDVVGMKQIAGLLARRVVSDAEVGERFERGQRIGIIKFGSRVDLYLPTSWEIAVAVGDRLTEGATVVARTGATSGAN